MLNHEVRTLACAVPAERQGGATYRQLPIGYSQKPTTAARFVIPTKSRSRYRDDGLRLGSVDAALLDLALRPAGTTRDEMHAMTGWQNARNCAVALMRAADVANARICQRQEADGTMRYFARYQPV